jgi:hypothetical protein
VGVVHIAAPRSQLTMARSASDGRHVTRRVPRGIVAASALVLLSLLAACGGRSRANVIKVDVPSIEPQRVPIRTLEPAPAPTPSPSPSPTAVPTASPVPMPPPRAATITSAAGSQKGDVGSYCWSEHVGGPSTCYTNDAPTQPDVLMVKSKEKVILRIDAAASPDDESIRPFQGSRSGFPDQQIEPALETELTIDLPDGTWSMDLCAAWHGRGQPICWLFKLKVGS